MPLIDAFSGFVRELHGTRWFVLPLGLLVYVLWQVSRKPTRPLPPGPRKLPLIGNLLDLPKDLGCVHWAKHKALYGPVSSITVLGQDIVILNDVEAVMELLEKRSSIYSDRPSFTFAGDLVGWKYVLGLAKYGDLMRAQRKHFHQIIGTQKLVEKFWSLQDIEAKRFVKRIIEEPMKLEHHARL